MNVSAGAGAGAGLTGHSQSGHGDALTGGSCTSEKVMRAAVAGGPLRAPCKTKQQCCREDIPAMGMLGASCRVETQGQNQGISLQGVGKNSFSHADILVCYNSMSKTSPSAFHGAIQPFLQPQVPKSPL